MTQPASPVRRAWHDAGRAALIINDLAPDDASVVSSADTGRPGDAVSPSTWPA